MNDSYRISGDSGRGIVFVHGRGFTPSAETHLRLLCRALEAGIEKDSPDELEAFASATKIFGYYGDLTNDLLRESGDDYDEQLDVNDLSNALNELISIDRKKGFGVKNYDRLPGKSAAREFAVTVMAPLVESIGLGKKIVSNRQKDLGAYWALDSNYRNAVLDRVREAIVVALNEVDHVSLLTHGTGSIVAYDALWQLSHDPDYADRCRDLKVDVWITLGSPLGDGTVKKQLLGHKASGRERFPTNVLAWHNVSAEDDYMSHDNTVSDDFKAMLTQRQISSIRDYRVYNMAIRYGRSNPHNVLGYLVHPRVSKITSDWLRLTDGRSLPRS
jgi:hypothetical protein